MKKSDLLVISAAQNYKLKDKSHTSSDITSYARLNTISKHILVLLLMVVFQITFAHSDFIIKIQTTTFTESYTIPTGGSGRDYKVRRRDNYNKEGAPYKITFIECARGDATPICTEPDIYMTTIRGRFPGIYFNGANDKDNIVAIGHCKGFFNLQRNAEDSLEPLVTNTGITFAETAQSYHLSIREINLTHIHKNETPSQSKTLSKNETLTINYNCSTNQYGLQPNTG